MRDATSQRSWRQSLAHGGTSEASRTLGNTTFPSSARFKISFGTVPRAALRFTSLRFAYPGLNSAAGYAGSVSLMLLLLTIACTKKEAQPIPTAAGAPSPATGSTPSASYFPAPTVEIYPTLLVRAQEVNDAFRRRDFARLVDLTYPKVIEAAGGRDKMIAALAKGIKEMETEGVSVQSSTAAAPIQIVHVSEWIYAVVPTTLKVKARDGIFKTESSMIGVSSDRGVNWTFIDAGGKDHTQLKSYLPAPADALKLPAEKEPVKISEN